MMFESHTEAKKYLIFSAILMSQQKNCKVGETWVVDAKNYKLPDCFFYFSEWLQHLTLLLVFCGNFIAATFFEIDEWFSFLQAPSLNWDTASQI